MRMNLKYILFFALALFIGTASELSAQVNAGREGDDFVLKSWNAAHMITTIQKFTTNTNAL